jgi:Leucine-rich repeat (LRR) protein
MQLDTPTVQVLAEVLKKNTAITSFDLTLNGPPEQGPQMRSTRRVWRKLVGAGVDEALATALQVTSHGFWFKKQQRVLAFSQCDKIKDLDLRHNFLEALPAKVLELLHLETLDASSNNLRTLPREVRQLTRLRTLNLDDNMLEKLPMDELLSLPALKSLTCKGNSMLCCPPPEIVRRGGEDVVKYLRVLTSRSVAFCMITHRRLGEGHTVSAPVEGDEHTSLRLRSTLPTEILRMVLDLANDSVDGWYSVYMLY